MSPMMMAFLQTGTSTYVENAMATTSPYNLHSASTSTMNNPSRMSPPPGGLGYVPQETLTRNMTHLMSMGHQMDESNHNMVNMLTQQIHMVFNPLIQNNNQSCELLANQMGRIHDFFGSPQVQARPNPQISNARPVETPDNRAALIN